MIKLAANYATLLLAFSVSAASAESVRRIELPGTATFPESISVDAQGNLYGSSVTSGGIWRIKPGAAKAQQWIKPGAFNSRSTFGVLADEKNKLLWVCSNDASFMGIAGPSAVKGSHLLGFDLESGDGRKNIPLPGAPSLCNDIAIDVQGNVYVTNSLAPQILKLKPGSENFEVWAEDPRFAPPPNGAGLDGIAIGDDGNFYVTNFAKGELYRVDQKGGAAGTITKLETPRPLVLPDGLRTFNGSRFLLAEGGGTIDLVTMAGDKAEIKELDGGLAGPTGVAVSDGKVFATEGQLQHLFDAKKNGPPELPFHVVAVPSPTESGSK
ncbi:MAG: hypothetical protein JSR78_08260 [Proteobacteria bacterium]|nr:hypothetical protein [Pseudomonadota bacterium]